MGAEMGALGLRSRAGIGPYCRTRLEASRHPGQAVALGKSRIHLSENSSLRVNRRGTGAPAPSNAEAAIPSVRPGSLFSAMTKCRHIELCADILACLPNGAWGSRAPGIPKGSPTPWHRPGSDYNPIIYGASHRLSNAQRLNNPQRAPYSLSMTLAPEPLSSWFETGAVQVARAVSRLASCYR